MNHRQLVERYFKERQERDAHFGGYPFITISRAAGAGGRALAEAIVRKLDEHGYTDVCWGWRIFDRELCEEIANEPDIHISLQSLLAERYQSDLNDFWAQLVAHETPQLKVHHRMCRLQRILASIGKVILVGRGAAFLTRDLRTSIRVRLDAPKADRIARLVRVLGITPEEARRQVDVHAVEQARFVRHMYNADVSDVSNYDAAWDTSVTPVEDIADALVARVKAKAKEVLSSSRP